MGSRLKTDPDHLFECFLEVAAPTTEAPEPHIVSTFPDDFRDQIVTKELPRFCFPCDLSRYNPAGQLFTFALTGSDNLQRFGFCRHPPGAKTAICFLSYLPWFDIFYKLLNKVASLKSNCDHVAAALLQQLYDVTVPSPGKQFRISINDGETTSEVLHTCPDDSRILPSIPENINMTEYFSAVTPENMIILFASLLHERRVLITSNRLHRLTACVHGAVSMLYPLHWQHIYIPVTPSHLIDYCSAPMPFIIGVHSSFMEQVRRMALDDVVILDADENTVETPFEDVQTLPSEAVNQLKHNLKNTSQICGDGVARSFLKTLVYLLGSYREALKLEDGGSQIEFDRDLFLSNGSKHEIAFRNSVLQLQHFTQFVESRVNALNQDAAIDDLFEEELDQRTSSSSKIPDGIKRKLVKAKAKSSVFYGKLKDRSRDARDKVMQGSQNLKVPVNVNPQAMKDAFYQTKHYAGKRINTMKDKLKFPKESEDILTMKRDQPDISPPIHEARSTPSSPASSPVLPRRKPSLQSFRPRTFMLPSQPKDKHGDKARNTKSYDVLEIDVERKMSLSEALMDDTILPAQYDLPTRYSDINIMKSVQPILAKLGQSSPVVEEEDSASQSLESKPLLDLEVKPDLRPLTPVNVSYTTFSKGSSGEPLPLPRKKRDKKKPEGGDNVSLRSNSSSSSLSSKLETSSSDSSSTSQGPSNHQQHHHHPTRSRPKGAPPPPPPPTYQQSSNNSNPVNLIDIASDSPDAPVAEGQFEDNFVDVAGVRRESTASTVSTLSSRRETLGQQLLEEYGLFFDTYPGNQPSSGTSEQASASGGNSSPSLSQKPALNRSSLADILSGTSVSERTSGNGASRMSTHGTGWNRSSLHVGGNLASGTNAAAAAGASVPPQQPPMSNTNSVQALNPKLHPNRSSLAGILSSAPYVTISEPTNSWGTAPPPQPPQSSSSSGNPFMQSSVPQTRSNPFHTPLTPSKSAEAKAAPAAADPFADLVSFQKTNISPVSKDSPHPL